MEVGPTCHYVMGGVRVEADSTASSVPGLFAAGECAGGLHGSNRLGGNSLSDLVVFGRRAGLYAAEYAKSAAGTPQIDADQVEEAARVALAPFEGSGGENPYSIHADLQTTMQDLVGIIRTGDELEKALLELQALKERTERMAVTGNRQFNPGWHLALDLRNMLAISEVVTRCALARKESRGGHTREDYPTTDPHFAKLNHVVHRRPDGEIDLREEPIPEMPAELQALFEEQK
jgi:succinate dehydrogenase / fumarate reductase flavoprotein subunit